MIAIVVIEELLIITVALSQGFQKTYQDGFCCHIIPAVIDDNIIL
jgi:hypothetical protein